MRQTHRLSRPDPPRHFSRIMWETMRQSAAGKFLLSPHCSWQEPQDKEWSMHRGCVPLGRIMPHIAISSWTLWGRSQVSATIGANGVGLEWMKFVPFGRFKAVCAIFRWSLYYYFFHVFWGKYRRQRWGFQRFKWSSRAERIRKENIRGTEKAMGVL